MDSDRATTRAKLCFVCRKPGCWSTNHTMEERVAARQNFVDNLLEEPDDFEAYVVEFEGLPGTLEGDEDPATTGEQHWTAAL